MMPLCHKVAVWILVSSHDDDGNLITWSRGRVVTHRCLLMSCWCLKVLLQVLNWKGLVVVTLTLPPDHSTAWTLLLVTSSSTLLLVTASNPVLQHPHHPLLSSANLNQFLSAMWNFFVSFLTRSHHLIYVPFAERRCGKQSKWSSLEVCGPSFLPHDQAISSVLPL